jgi:hypothetical protein
MTQQAPQPAQSALRKIYRDHANPATQCHSVSEGALCARVPEALRNGGQREGALAQIRWADGCPCPGCDGSLYGLVYGR